MPSRPPNRSDGNSPLVSKISLDIDGHVVDLPTHEYLQSIETDINDQSGGKITVTLFDSGQDVLEDLILGLRNSVDETTTARKAAEVSTGGTKAVSGRMINVQFGWDTGGAAEFPLYQALITGYEPHYAPEGTTLTISAVSKGVVAAALDRKPRAFSAGMSASDVFRNIAADNGWPMVVEDSSGTLDAVSSNMESDVAFLRKKVLPRAIGANRQSFVLYWDSAGTAHFHTPGFRGTQAQGTQTPLDADYRFASDAWGDVEEFEPSDNVLASAVFGAGSATYTGPDSVGGTQINANATTSVGPAGATVDAVGDGVYRPEASPFKQARIHVPCRSTEEFQQLVAHRWSDIARASFRARLKVRGTHAMQVGGWVRVRRLRRDGREHHMSGVFMVTGVKHTFGSGWSTDAELVRTGTGYTPGAAAATSVNAKAPVIDSGTQTAQASEPAGPAESFSDAAINP